RIVNIHLHEEIISDDHSYTQSVLLRLVCKRWNTLLNDVKNIRLLKNLRLPVLDFILCRVGCGYGIRVSDNMHRV
ncbi:hypothetical protein PFISCL1PPCAC_28163, partial [Pristionchus fissidentatus]